MNLIIPNFFQIHSNLNYGEVTKLNLEENSEYGFVNNDSSLRKACDSVLERRSALGLEGLIGDLKCIIINTEDFNFVTATSDFLNFTNYAVKECFEDKNFKVITLSTPGSADVIIRSRKNCENPFHHLNLYPKSKHLPNTRLETFVFEAFDLENYVNIQKSRGIRFLTQDIIETENYKFIQTVPSHFTGNSLGFIQWTNSKHSYAHGDSTLLNISFPKIRSEFLSNISILDHAATRVKAIDRDAALIEFMELTNYCFDFAIYIDTLNSITNVARLQNGVFAAVFTSGISPYVNDTVSGPTEKFTNNYGARVHHLAFKTEHIDNTVNMLRNQGMHFISELVGSPEEGIKQIFSAPSKSTLLVNEYIHRYGSFDGFFTKGNVAHLTKATDNQ